MVVFTHLAIAASAIVGALAAPAPGADLPDFTLGGKQLHRRQDDYTQNYKTGGNVNFNPSGDSYSVTFSGAQDFVVGKGWSVGTTR